MAKKITVLIKLQVPGGQANPAPPIGPALGQHGVNIMEFCKKFNELTKDKVGTIIPVVITVYEDKSFTFIMKTPPVAAMIKKAAGLAKASGEAGRATIGKISQKDVEEIAKAKLKDLNTEKLPSAMRMVEGAARSMGIEVTK
jgi:large subunit ribosomal protein L11